MSHSRSKLSAVVMAGGRGTRMRSAVPKHLHPLLGRRMVDWIVEAARPLAPEPLVIVASPDTATEFPGTDRRGSGAIARYGRRGAEREGGSSPARTRSWSSRATRRCSRRASSRSSSRRTGRRAQERPFSRSSRTMFGATGESSGTPTAASSRSWRLSTPRRSSSKSTKRTRRSTSSAPISCGRLSTGCSPSTRRASCTSRTPSAISSRQGIRLRFTSRPMLGRPRVSTRASNWPLRRQRSGIGSTRHTCWPA